MIENGKGWINEGKCGGFIPCGKLIQMPKPFIPVNLDVILR